MRRIPVLSSDVELNTRVRHIFARFGNVFEPVFFESVPEMIEMVRYDLPEFQLLNLSDERVDAFSLIQLIADDPWLLYGGIIGVYARKDAARVRELPRRINIVTMIPRAQFVQTFFRVVKILVQNRQILFQRDIEADFLGTVNGSFEMDNDPFNARTYASLVSNFLFNANYVDVEMRDRLHVAIFEMLINAIEHGNCEISYEEKTAFIAEHGDIVPLIRDRCRLPEIRRRRVFFAYRITPERSFFTIRDDGSGFDWRARLQNNDVNLHSHGHGIRMTRHYIENLSYNDAGNIVSFEYAHRKLANAKPMIFADEADQIFEPGEVVFCEGEESNDLYYIVAGRLKIVSGSQQIAELTPDDMFLGEMSFLLGNRRSATVVAAERTILVRITKNTFVTGIQRRPHYGIFLARLLAQRLSRLNQQVASSSG